MSRSLALAIVPAVLVAMLWGCGAAAPTVRSSADRAVDDESFAEVRRRFLELAPDDPARTTVQARLLTHLAGRSEAILQGADYDEIVAHLGAMTMLLSPEDFAQGRTLPSELRPLAEHVALHGARRGDEARVLAAELILAALDAERADAHRGEYERVSSWGREARMPPTDDLMALVEGGMGLIAVWEEHARLTPSAEVLARLAGIYLGLRDSMRGTTLTDGFRPPRSLGDMEHLEMAAVIMQRAPLEAAAVFLSPGDLDSALGPPEGGPDRGDTWRVRRVVEDARGADSRGAQALSEIASGFAEGRPDVAVGLCRLGLRRFPSDGRFPLCLARVSAARGAIGDTADYYVGALALAGDDVALYDEALEAIATMIERGAFAQSRDVGEVRTAGRAAHTIVAERALRFPGAEPGPLDQPTLHLALARAELTSGHADAARAEFEESVSEARRMSEAPRAAVVAREELAELELRSGSPARAQALLQEALDLVSQGRESDALRARLLAHVGDAQRFAGDGDAALQSYRQALTLLSTAPDAARARERAELLVERGVVLRRLGDLTASRAAFEQAIGLAPAPGLAAEILSHLVMDVPDA